MMKKISLLLLIAMVFASCQAQKENKAQAENLFPYLSIDNQFGYVDSDGKLVIDPQYEDAKLFKNGFAVVKKDGKYGVINTKNERIAPFKYAAAEIVHRGNFTFLISKKEYNAWWNFWEWKLWPGLSFLGTSSGPFIVTKVPKAKWELRSLPKLKVLYHKRKLDFDLGVSYWNSNWKPRRYIPEHLKPQMQTTHYLRLVKRFYKMEKDGTLKKQSQKMIKLLNDSTFIYRRGQQYYLGDADGKALRKKRYVKADTLFTKTYSGDTISVPKKNPNMPPYSIIQQTLYKDDSGHFYIYPKMNTAFPSKIGDYTHDTTEISGSDILRSAVLISPWNERDFIVISFAGSTSGYRVYFLNKSGEWKNRIPNYNNIVPNHSSRDLVISHGKQFWAINTDFQIKKFPGDFIPIWGHPKWYFVKDPTTQKYGIYNLTEKKWLISPQYYALETTAEPDVAIYSVKIKEDDIEKTKYGLLNMATKKQITKPIYNWIEEEGRVRHYENEKFIEFYVDLKTGKAYR